MTSCSGAEALRAKQEFEAWSASHGIQISHYHADNGRFAEAVFKDDLRLNAQSIAFCGVNAHHQNGIVERQNRSITESARTMLLHAERLWPEGVSPLLWPFALKYAVHIHNHFSLNDKGLSPLEQFTGHSLLDDVDLTDFHTFGSPCYVLDAAQHVPKWDPRSSLQIFVGFSALHARNVAMVLSPFSGLVSPQYHVTFDDHFQTLNGLRDTTVPESWKDICIHNSTRLKVEERFSQSSNITESGGEA